MPLCYNLYYSIAVQNPKYLKLTNEAFMRVAEVIQEILGYTRSMMSLAFMLLSSMVIDSIRVVSMSNGTYTYGL